MSYQARQLNVAHTEEFRTTTEPEKGSWHMRSWTVRATEWLEVFADVASDLGMNTWSS